jgi:hypothetical protein
MESGVELINLSHGVDYAPTNISTDKRNIGRSTLSYWQIGETQQYGHARGPIFRVDFVDLSGVSPATHIKVWGIDNIDSDAAIFPVTYISTNPQLPVYLRKFEFTDSSGNTVAPGGNYSAIGYKKRVIPIAW